MSSKFSHPEGFIAIFVLVMVMLAAQSLVTRAGKTRGWGEAHTEAIRGLIGAAAFAVTLLALFWAMPYIMYPFEYLRDLMWANR